MSCVVGYKFADLFFLSLGSRLATLSARQGRRTGFYLVRSEFVGELDGELHKQISESIVSLVERHSQALGAHDRVGLNNVTWCARYADLPSIEMLEDEVDASERLYQSNGVFDEQIGSLALEQFVFALGHLDYQVAVFLRVRHLVTMPVQDNLLPMRHALFKLDFVFLFLPHNSFALTHFAHLLLIKHLAFAIAVVALLTNLRVHAGANHLHALDDAGAITGTALTYCTCVATSHTVARITKGLSVYRYREFFSVV